MLLPRLCALSGLRRAEPPTLRLLPAGDDGTAACSPLLLLCAAAAADCGGIMRSMPSARPAAPAPTLSLLLLRLRPGCCGVTQPNEAAGPLLAEGSSFWLSGRYLQCQYALCDKAGDQEHANGGFQDRVVDGSACTHPV